MREGIGDGAVGARLTDESLSYDGNSQYELERAAGVLSRDGLIDYLSVAPGGSSTYRGSSWIVPPAPVEHNAIAPVRADDADGGRRAGDRDRPDRRARRRRPADPRGRLRRDAG